MKESRIIHKQGFFDWAEHPALHVKLPQYDLSGVKKRDLEALQNMPRKRKPGHMHLVSSLCGKDENIRFVLQDGRAVALDQETMHELHKLGATLLSKPYMHPVSKASA